ncbi:MAG: hypothetical protein IT581_17925 [Verrucomicrobiales bacterium]|nr:hypothetical protein [Verrucomicrobiales bacterium]
MNLDKNQMLLGGTSAAAVIMLVFGNMLSNTMGMQKGALYAIGFALVVVVIAMVASKVMSRGASKRRGDAMGDEMEKVTKKGTASDDDGSQDASDVGLKVSEGIRKLREDGYNLGSFPFYLVIGEPKGGKTVACQALLDLVGPIAPGMNNRYAGEGGTINLDFFFLQESVIIDTAGRMTFEDTPEWVELLDSLKRGRPDKPISGVLISVPADKLLLESAEAEQIRESDATRLSAALKGIQNRLGVRFPVYVVVTKSDLIPGFREYFSTTGAKGQAQVFGWSRAPKESGVKHVDAANEVLDRPYSRDEMDRGLRSLVRSTQEQMLSLLADPKFKNKKEASLFPFSFADATERLVEMVDQVFQAQARRTMRPFLRGVYFTSCKQTQPILSVLAERLGVPVNQLQAGQAGMAKEGHIPFFLKNLFQNRILKESELVTSVDNLTRSRKQALIQLGVAGAVSMALLVLAVVGGYRSLEKSVNADAAAFGALANGLSGGPFKPSGNKPNVQVISEMMERVADGFPTPLIYRPISWFSRKVQGRQETFRVAFAGDFFANLLRSTRENLAKASRDGIANNESFANRWLALAELMDMTESVPRPLGAAATAPASESRPTNFTAILYPAVAADAAPGQEGYLDYLRASSDAYFANELRLKDGRDFWMKFANDRRREVGKVLSDSFDALHNVVLKQIDNYRAASQLADAEKLAEAYGKAERSLRDHGNLSVLEPDKLVNALVGLGAPTFEEAYRKESGPSVGEATNRLESFRARLDKSIHRGSTFNEFITRIDRSITNAQGRANTSAELNKYRRLDEVLLVPLDPDNRRPFQKRYATYEAAGGTVPTLFDGLEAIEDPKTTDWTVEVQKMRDAIKVPLESGTGDNKGDIQVLQNVYKVREFAFKASITNSWEAFESRVKDLLTSNEGSKSEALYSLGNVAAALRKFPGSNTDLRPLVPKKNELLRLIEAGQDKLVQAYVTQKQTAFWRNVHFPLVPTFKGPPMTEDEIKTKLRDGDSMLNELKRIKGIGESELELVRKDVEAVRTIATRLINGAKVELRVDLTKGKLTTAQTIVIATGMPGSSNVVMGRGMSGKFTTDPKAALSVSVLAETTATGQGGVVAFEEKSYGLLHALAKSETGRENLTARIPFPSGQFGDNYLLVEVVDDVAFPLKQWFELGGRIALY